MCHFEAKNSRTHLLRHQRLQRHVCNFQMEHTDLYNAICWSNQVSYLTIVPPGVNRLGYPPGFLPDVTC